MTTTFIDRMAVEVQGEGEPVVMLHGLGGDSNTWAPMMQAFSRQRAVRIDLPGSGRSHRVEGELSCAGFVKAVLRVMDALQIESAPVVAHSMGAIVATHLAVYEPKRVKSLALFGPLLAPPEGARTALRARGEKARVEREAGMQWIADALVQASVSGETRKSRLAAAAFVRESIMRQCPDGYARSCDALAAMQPADTDRVQCPVLLVTGDEDVVAPPQSVRAMADRFAQAHVEVLRGCGHWTPMEMPERCMDFLTRFNASTASRAPRQGALR
jgi:3-oxoadipate enol-lactonase